MIFFLKNLILGSFVFFTPVIIFLNNNNLKLLSSNELKEIIFSELLVYFVFIIISSLIYLIILKFFKSKINSFIYLSTYYFLLHFYLDIKIYLKNYIQTIDLNHFLLSSIGESSLILITFIVLFFIFFHLKYKSFRKIINRTFLLIAIFNYIYYQFPNIYNLLNVTPKEFINLEKSTYPKIKEEINFSRINKLKKINNVYYIILDGMMPLELAENQFIINNKDKIIENYKSKNFNYIKNSISSYNFTHNTLASIWNIDYLPSELNYINYEGFPNTLWKSLKEDHFIPLEYVLSEANINFYWLGNMIVFCQEKKFNSEFIRNPHWQCLNKFKHSILIKLSNTRFNTTPLNDILIKLNKNKKNNEGQKNLSKYISDYSKEINSKNPKFIFIHNMSPHWPFSLSADCSNRAYDKWAQLTYNYNGYKESYLCMLKEINLFIDFINHTDPNAVVVIQADHGWIIREDDIRMKDHEVHERAQIFNLIKAPDKCLNKKPKLQNNVNTIRFVFNCIFSEDLNYRENIHYEKTWGKEYSHTNQDKINKHIFN